jgi:predicted nucleic acid-binding protein
VGSLVLPTAGQVGVDSQVIICTVEKHPIYAPILRPLWACLQVGTLTAAASELATMEVLVGPLKSGNTALVTRFERFFTPRDLRLEPVSLAVLRQAATLRATTRLRTPDAIHAATALVLGCPMFLTNDRDFQKVPGLPVTVLDDLLKP